MLGALGWVVLVSFKACSCQWVLLSVLRHGTTLTMLFLVTVADEQFVATSACALAHQVSTLQGQETGYEKGTNLRVLRGNWILNPHYNGSHDQLSFSVTFLLVPRRHVAT